MIRALLTIMSNCSLLIVKEPEIHFNNNSISYSIQIFILNRKKMFLILNNLMGKWRERLGELLLNSYLFFPPNQITRLSLVD